MLSTVQRGSQPTISHQPLASHQLALRDASAVVRDEAKGIIWSD